MLKEKGLLNLNVKWEATETFEEFEAKAREAFEKELKLQKQQEEGTERSYQEIHDEIIHSPNSDRILTIPQFEAIISIWCVRNFKFPTEEQLLITTIAEASNYINWCMKQPLRAKCYNKKNMIERAKNSDNYSRLINAMVHSTYVQV